MKTYEQMKGRAKLQPQTADLQFPGAKAAKVQTPQLNEAQAAHAFEMAQLHKTHMPDCKAFVKGLIDEGLIDGWRNFKNITVEAGS